MSSNLETPPPPPLSLLTSSSPIGEHELQRIFRDLYRGVRAEETLDLRANPSDLAASRTSSQDDLISITNVVLLNQSAELSIAEASVALSGAFWLQHNPSSNDSDLALFISRFMESHSYAWAISPADESNNLPTAQLSGGPVTPQNPHTRLSREFHRYIQCVDSFGWGLFALLALSPSFQTAASDLTPAAWDHLYRLIGENRGSFKIIANTIRLRFGIILVKTVQDPYIRATLGTVVIAHSDALEESKAWLGSFIHLMKSRQVPENLLDPMSIRYQTHPHRWYVSLDKQDARPIPEPYIPLRHCVLGPEYAGLGDPRRNPSTVGTNSPGIRQGKDEGEEPCEMCKSSGAENCDAMLQTFAPEPLVELFETEVKGIGVRTLQKIPRLHALGEYAGKITKDVLLDDIYVLTGPFQPDHPQWYLISSMAQGNFTRFANHSCDPNTMLCSRDYGNREIPIMLSIKNIGMFEEITTDYGHPYFVHRGMPCLCRTPECEIGPDSYYMK